MYRALIDVRSFDIIVAGGLFLLAVAINLNQFKRRKAFSVVFAIGSLTFLGMYLDSENFDRNAAMLQLSKKAWAEKQPQFKERVKILLKDLPKYPREAYLPDQYSRFESQGLSARNTG